VRCQQPKVCHIKQLPVVSQRVPVARPSVRRTHRRGGFSRCLRGVPL
ncbi:MAG: hypothetical protein AVDCRST_MAG55-877, partial [uncultured Rubrobacteraceae bacterium]